MSDQPLDPRYEKLIALLYGELSEEEEAILRRDLARDAGLREEWEGLKATRSLLGSWEVTDPAPGFVLLEHEEKRVRRAPSSPWAARLRRLTGGLSWGVAACAALLLVLALGRVHVQRVDGGVTFRLGGEHAAPAGGRPTSEPLLTQVRPVSDQQWMTKEEFQAYSAGVTQTMLALLNDYSRQRDHDVVGLVRAAYSQIEQKQSQDYTDLKTRIEAFGLGLARQQYSSDARLDLLMKQNQEGTLRPANETAPAGGEGEQK